MKTRMIESHIFSKLIDFTICKLITEVNAQSKKTKTFIERLCRKRSSDLGQRKLLKTKSGMLVTSCILQHDFFSDVVFVFWMYCGR